MDAGALADIDAQIFRLEAELEQLRARRDAARPAVARAQEASAPLREQELRQRLDAVPELIWSTRADGHHDFYNARWYEFTGVEPGSTDGDGWAGMFHEEDQPAAWEAWRRSLETGEPYEVEYRLRRHTGEYRWMLGRALPMRDETGAIVRWMGTCSDIHDLKRTADELRRISALLTHIGDSAPDLIYAKDRQSRIVYANLAAQCVIGLPSEKLVGRSDLEFTASQAEAEENIANDKAVMEGGGPVDIDETFTTPDGETRYYRSVKAPMRDADGEVIGVVGISSDITERRAAEQALIASEARFRNLAAAVPGFIFITDAEGRNTYTNEAYQQYCGASEEELRGDGWLARLHPDDRASAQAVWTDALARGESFQLEYRLGSASGEHRWFLCNVAPFRDAEGQVVQWTGVGIDVHQLKTLDVELQRQRDLLEAVLETSPDPIFAKDTYGAYVFANAATARALGVTGRPLAGMKASEVFPPDLYVDIAQHDARVLAGEKMLVEERVQDGARAPRTFMVTKTPMTDAAGEVRGLVAVARDITDRKEHERHRELLVNELNHRVKNTLSLVQNLARQSLRDVDVDVRSAFEGRLVALAGAHDVLTDHSWEAAFLDELVARALGPFQQVDRPERIQLNGPRMRVESRHAVALTLALHELATNAVKYGALSSEHGRVIVNWWLLSTLEGPQMRLLWSERDGPPVRPPSTRGFGTRMIERGVAQDLQGSVKLDYAEQGVTCEITAPLPYKRADTAPSG